MFCLKYSAKYAQLSLIFVFILLVYYLKLAKVTLQLLQLINYSLVNSDLLKSFV